MHLIDLSIWLVVNRTLKVNHKLVDVQTKQKLLLNRKSPLILVGRRGLLLKQSKDSVFYVVQIYDSQMGRINV